MHHDHRGFDQADHDATQALEDALPVVAELLNEKLKPQPKAVDDLRAWRERIEDLHQQLAPIAARIGWSVNELEKTAEAELRQQLRGSLATRPEPIAPPARPAPPTFGELALEMEALGREVAAIGAEQSRLYKLEREKLTRMNIVRKLLYPHGRLRRAR